MKKITFLFILLSFICLGTSQSQVLLDENFNYPPGDSLTAHGWTWINSYVNTILVATGSLTYSGYSNSGIGNNVRMHNTGQDIYRQCDSTLTGSVYVSFLINVDTVQATGDYFFALLPNSSTSNYTMRTFIKSAAGGYQIGISKSTEAATYTSATYNLNTTYLVIVKYTFNTGTTTDDELRLFVLSGTIPGSEPAATVGPITGASTDSPNISRIVLRQGTASNAPVLNIDGFRVFRSWGNLVPIHTITTIADNFSLKQNYPNPFNPSTNIEFSLKNASNVKLIVYDMMGREVTTLVNERVEAGVHYATFDAKLYSSGAYIYKMTAVTETGETFTQTKSMVLVK